MGVPSFRGGSMRCILLSQSLWPFGIALRTETKLPYADPVKKAEFQRNYRRNRWASDPSFKSACKDTWRSWHERKAGADPSYKTKRNRRRVLGRYGLPEGAYDKMLQEQGGRCAICRKEPAAGKHFSVDHCHSSGRVRGLLCSPCNTGIGQLGDDPDKLRHAIAYLERWNA